MYLMMFVVFKVMAFCSWGNWGDTTVCNFFYYYIDLFSLFNMKFIHGQHTGLHNASYGDLITMVKHINITNTSRLSTVAHNLQTTFSNTILWKILVLWIKAYLSLFS